MGNIGGGEILLILLIALIVLGPDKLPGAARQAGDLFRQFKAMSFDFRSEFESALNAPDQPIAQSTEELAAEEAARQRGSELVAAENRKKEIDAGERAATTPNDEHDSAESSPADDTVTADDTETTPGPFQSVSPTGPASMAYRPKSGPRPCPTCERMNPRPAKFCSDCGSSMTPAEASTEAEPIAETDSESSTEASGAADETS